MIDNITTIRLQTDSSIVLLKISITSKAYPVEFISKGGLSSTYLYLIQASSIFALWRGFRLNLSTQANYL